MFSSPNTVDHSCSNSTLLARTSRLARLLLQYTDYMNRWGPVNKEMSPEVSAIFRFPILTRPEVSSHVVCSYPRNGLRSNHHDVPELAVIRQAASPQTIMRTGGNSRCKASMTRNFHATAWWGSVNGDVVWERSRGGLPILSRQAASRGGLAGPTL